MKKIYISIITLLISFNIVAQNNQKSFTPNDSILLRQLVDQFDKILMKYYPGEQIATCYKNYITDVSKQKGNINMLYEQNPIQLIQSIKETPLFDKIWKLYTMKPNYSTNSKNPSESKESPNSVFIIDFNGTFFNELIKNCNNKEMKDSYKTIKEVGGVNPIIFSNALVIGYTDQDYELYETKLAIAIMFYYSFILK